MMIRTATMVMVLAAAAAGCLDTSNAPSEQIQPLPAPMVSADRDGAHLDIYELTPGSLAVVATGDVPDAVEGKTPVEIYELIAQRTAPPALVERQARIAQAQALNGTREPGSVTKVANPARSQISSLTANSFSSSFCSPTDVDFDYCFTNRGADDSIELRNIRWIHSHVNAYAGSVSHTMTYRAFAGSWHLINTDTTVSGSSFVSTFEETANGDYEIFITNAMAAGDGYHWSLHGDF